MHDFSADLLRGCVSSIMNAALLFVLARPKYSRRINIFALVCVLLVNILMSIYFYCINDLTSLAKASIFIYLGLIIFMKPLIKDGIFQWMFNCLTAMNIFIMIVFISYHLAGFFPYPPYFNSIIRILLYVLIIGMFCKFVSPFYQKVMENWRIYFFLVLSMSLNFIYYIVSTDDIVSMLSDKFMPMLLLTIMCIFLYITIFYFQHKSIASYLLQEEKQHYKDLAYMDTLTGVLNRNGYENYTANKLQMSYDNFIIGVFDINNLKVVNDSLGHEIGDTFIFEASRIICTAFRNSTIFRIGGDEFVSVSINMLDNDIETQHREMLDLLCEYNSKSSYPIDLGIAFGYALQDAPVSVEELFTKADRNMYVNKMDMKKGKFK